MFVNHDKKMMFIHVPHTGGGSMSILLQEFYGFEKYLEAHSKVSEITDYHDYFKFAIIRHPYTRLPSMYRFFKKKHPEEAKGLNFNHFIMRYCPSHSMTDWQYIPTQRDFFLSENKNRLDLAVPYENMNKPLQAIANRLLVDIKELLDRYENIQEHNYGEYKHDQWFDKKSKWIIDNMCHRDFECYYRDTV